MIIRDKTNKYFSFFVAEMVALFTAGLLLFGLVSGTLGSISAISTWGLWLITLAFIQAAVYLVYWCFHHEIYNGLRYAIIHAHILREVKTALLDAGAGYIIEQYSGQEKTARLPQIVLKLDPNLRCGLIKIRSHIRYSDKLENLNLSSALGKYVVEQQYISDDMNLSSYSKARLYIFFSTGEKSRVKNPGKG